jgi:hypothetical protein
MLTDSGAKMGADIKPFLNVIRITPGRLNPA